MGEHTAEAREAEYERARREDGTGTRGTALSAPLSVLVPRELKRWVAQEAARRTRELGVKVSVGAIVRAALEAYRGQPNPPETTA